ncbi:hypothetical protein AXG93_1520s1000 [Marchantia polymorpha subsp. ruderalis]|uniref:Integrase catalytic domain-containing protein n=1 Tax=Marchantia polymorpha subsp. ruderalis TaxID=1480154 RepID=A0A176VH79_MARPO|nr:hypothetical protein AXG93_1520s1000 [Marchantia polymorpha subsp. ruderalis]
MHTQVQQLVSRCIVCDRVRASFNAPTPELHPLPIMGLGYRWSLDFAGPLPLTVRHHRYVLVMVEHFSKWIELVALPDKASEGVAYAFLDRVLSHYGAPAEVLTDQGTEFQGEFQVLCDKALIDHRTTSRDHPEADGLAERVVQTVKRALRKRPGPNGRFLLRGSASGAFDKSFLVKGSLAKRLRRKQEKVSSTQAPAEELSLRTYETWDICAFVKGKRICRQFHVKTGKVGS